MTAGRGGKSRTAFRRTAGVFIAAVFSAGWARSQTETGNTAGSLSERGTREPRGDGRIGNTRGSKMSNELLRQHGRACKTGPVFLSVGQKERLRGGRKQTGEAGLLRAAPTGGKPICSGNKIKQEAGDRQPGFLFFVFRLQRQNAGGAGRKGSALTAGGGRGRGIWDVFRPEVSG